MPDGILPGRASHRQQSLAAARVSLHLGAYVPDRYTPYLLVCVSGHAENDLGWHIAELDGYVLYDPRVPHWRYFPACRRGASYVIQRLIDADLDFDEVSAAVCAWVRSRPDLSVIVGALDQGAHGVLA